jgi:RES domain-containing protein
VDLWRLTLYPSLDGEGGRLYPGRWNSGGEPMVYLAACPPGALIEILVHLELGQSELPPSYGLVRVAVPPKLHILELVPDSERWHSDEALTRKLGDGWLKSRRSVLARVPSAILPATFNYLLNPRHPDAARITIAEVHSAALDLRLLR